MLIRAIEHVPDDLFDVWLTLARQSLDHFAFALDVFGDLGQVGIGYFAIEHPVGIQRDVDALLTRAEARVAPDLYALFARIELLDEIAQLVE